MVNNIYKALKKEKFEHSAVWSKKDTVNWKKFIEPILIHTNTANIDVPEVFFQGI